MTENHFQLLFSPFHFSQFFSQNGRRRPFWMTENHFRLHFSPFQINTQLLFFSFFFIKWPPAAILDTENYFRSQFSPFQINTQLFFKLFTIWPPEAILDYRKSLSITFLAISDQYTTFFFQLFFSKWPLTLEVRFPPKIGFFHDVLSMDMSNMKLIGEFMTKLETPQVF